MSSLGAAVRKSLGRYERPVSDLYRSVFINLEDLAANIRDWSQPKRILEIGCGEGALAELVVRDFPEAEYLGIDIISHLGRMYVGPQDKVEFRQVTAEYLANELPGKFDLILINDVMHHVPEALRLGLLAAAKDLLAPEGALIFKDWVRRPSPIHALCYVADVYVGGDKSVRYMPMDEQRNMLSEVFGNGSIIAEANIRPWNHNQSFLVRPVQ